jgi:Flp pilus assembly pilin Flp
MNSLRRLITREDGQDLLEYGLLMTLIAIFCLAAMRILAAQITATFWGTIASVNFF